MRIQRHPLLLSFVIHAALVAALFAFAFKSALFESVPIELSEISARTASLNSPTEKKTKAIVLPTAKPFPLSESAGPAPKNTAQSNASPDSTYTGPVAEEYEVGEMPILLNEVRIPYPQEAKAKGIQGNVIFDLIVDQNGKVADVKMVSSPDESLSAAASQAVKQFRFKPAKLSDKPVAIKIRYSYRFILQ